MKKAVKIFQLFWPAFVPVILLNIVALRQIYLANVDHLDFWKGGGFGMFSRINSRFFHVHLLNRGAFECAMPSPDQMVAFNKIKNYPKYLSLENLTKKLTKKIWIYQNINQPQKSVTMIGNHQKLRAEDTIAKFDSVEIQVFDVSFNKQTFTLEPKLIRKIKYLK